MEEGRRWSEGGIREFYGRTWGGKFLRRTRSEEIFTEEQEEGRKIAGGGGLTPGRFSL